MTPNPNGTTESRVVDHRPTTLGSDYAAAVYFVLEATDEISHRGWHQRRWTDQGAIFHEGVYDDLYTRHTRANSLRGRAHQLGLELLEIDPTQALKALGALNIKFRELLTERLELATRHFQARFPSCHHVCDEHPPYGLGADSDVVPVTAEQIASLPGWLRGRTASDIGGRYEVMLHSAVSTLTALLFEVHQPDDPSGDGRRQRLAENIVYIENALVDIDASADCFATYTPEQAAHAFAAFNADNEKRLDQRIHDTRHRLQPNESEPCRTEDCNRNYPGYPHDPWSATAAAAASTAPTAPALQLVGQDNQDPPA